MIYLQSFDEFNKYLELDSKKIINADPSLKTKGWYKYLNGNLSILFIAGNEIVIQYDNQKFFLNDSITAKTSSKENECIFQLYNGTNLILIFSYTVDKSLYNIEPFDFIDEEDFDWGLFLCNIINNKIRQEILVETYNLSS